MNIVMTSFQERKYGVDGEGKRRRRDDGEIKLKPYWKIMEERAEEEKKAEIDAEKRGFKKRKLEDTTGRGVGGRRGMLEFDIKISLWMLGRK